MAERELLWRKNTVYETDASVCVLRNHHTRFFRSGASSAAESRPGRTGSPNQGNSGATSRDGGQSGQDQREARDPRRKYSGSANLLEPGRPLMLRIFIISAGMFAFAAFSVAQTS